MASITHVAECGHALIAGEIPVIAGHTDAGHVWHVAWGGTACLGQHIEIAQACAESLGLREGTRVTMKALEDVPGAHSVSVEPANADDWEVVEAQAEYIEANLLSQVSQCANECLLG